MATITVRRISPDSTSSPDIEVTLPQLPQTWSWSNIIGMIPTSLSGEKGDYDWNFDIPTSTLSISSKLSYQQRFYAKQTDVDDLKARMATLEDKLHNRDLADEYFLEVMMKVQIYTSLGRSLHIFWFRKLPRHVQEGLSNAELFNLPRCFAVWWFLWSKADPANFPMPEIVSNSFPRYAPDADDSRISGLLVDVDDKQTELGNLLEEAWNRIDNTDRLLMIVCWAARQEDHAIRNIFAHPTISRADAASIISGDPRLQSDGGGARTDTTRKDLLARALTLINAGYAAGFI